MLKGYRLFFYQITRPFSYLKIQHPDKNLYNWWLPFFLGGSSSVLVFLAGGIHDLFGDPSVIFRLTRFVENLPGFFIAALAAVATFNGGDIDDLMTDPPKIDVLYNGGLIPVKMTRRRFLCVLFSYLTAISLVLVVLGVLGENVSSMVPVWLMMLGCFMFLIIFWQMIVATFLGLYYLGERLHTPQ